MLESLKNNVRLLRRSKRHVILFELTYKLLAVAVIYPILTAAINLCMKVAGIRYLTNEYIVKALTNPVVIIALFTGIILFVGYCIYEMAYLAVCFETKRKGNNASIIDNIYNAYLRLKNLIRIQSIPLFLFFFISIIFINVTIVANLIYSDTLSNLIGSTMRRNRYMIYMLVAIVMVLIYYYVIRGIFSFNIYMMEGKNFRQSYKKSSQIVRNNRLRVIMSVIVYNLAIFVAIAVFYTVISLILIGGVKLLDMAYLGSAVYLSVLRELRAGVKIFLVFISIPCSFSMISYMYYKYSDLDDIAHMLVDMLNTEAMTSAWVSYSNIADDLKQLPDAYKEARTALEVGKIFYTGKNVFGYNRLGIGRLIYQLPVEICEMFIDEFFKEETLDSIDDETLATIRTFFENNLNLSETSRQLYVHRNTLVYRFEKLQKKFGLDIRTFEDALTFKLAMMVVNYIKYKKAE